MTRDPGRPLDGPRPQQAHFTPLEMVRILIHDRCGWTVWDCTCGRPDWTGKWWGRR